MSIKRKDIEHLANLSRLSFNQIEEEKLIKDLNSILKYVDKLNEIDTECVDKLINPYYIENKFREDEVEESINLEDIIKNVPESFKNYISVPNVID